MILLDYYHLAFDFKFIYFKQNKEMVMFSILSLKFYFKHFNLL